MENHGKSMKINGKSMENHGTSMKINGKSMENHGKSMKINGQTMENHGTSTGNIKALRFYHVLAPTSRGFNSVSTDNFPIFGETWGNMGKNGW